MRSFYNYTGISAQVARLTDVLFFVFDKLDRTHYYLLAFIKYVLATTHQNSVSSTLLTKSKIVLDFYFFITCTVVTFVT